MDLAEEVRTAVEAFSSGSAEGVALTVPSTPVMMEGDSDRIQQVLSNLLDNARKNSPPDVPIEVSLTEEDGRARIVVEDHGAGIDPDQLERIFDKFVRGREGTVTGTGLGLYISRRIVDAHEGRIWAESRVGESTRFVVELPLPAPVRN
jgi:signal transduction histidine kinase